MTTATTPLTFDLGGDLTVHRLGYGACLLGLRCGGQQPPRKHGQALIFT